ncbi:MAG: phospho-N-acetylmuramoyl-pentapeptide-transferase, partial [Candidatus Omnitrophica bacterium]|nr:phospho-N-acetylmuramoyl-pentapeptide-transferase [Candidatus Omnitrophota bacterium]
NKEKTPSMGGLLVLWSILISNFFWADLRNIYVLMLIMTLCWLGLLGFFDDYMKMTKMNPKGLRPRTKIIAQICIGFILGLILYYHPALNFSSYLYVPFFKNISFNLGPYYVLLTTFIIVATSNAVNLTDGLDGLAAGTVLMASVAFGFILYTVGNAVFSRYLNLPFVQGIGETTVFCGSLVGAILGFLWYNCHPAEIFMGDTGSLPLGGIVGLFAIISKQEISLIIVGGIFVMEALSVVMQVISFKTRKKRIFKMTPLHHHFELLGWKESQVVVRFWILAIIFALFTLITLKIR